MGKQRKQQTRTAAWGGFDLSTTGLALGIRSARGEEAYAQTRMRGAVTWNGQPAFELSHIGTMIESLLSRLKDDGWSFDGCSLSFAVRQHDMVLLDTNHQLLMPALSWQCNAATAEVRRLRTLGAEETVGRIEERFILPKLMWALGKERRLKRALAHVMTTGDWITLMLTGKARLSTSDALSNGLLTQDSKRLAGDVMQRANLNPDWFPKVIQSGRVVGTTSRRPVPGDSSVWASLRAQLPGAKIVAGLGDNHATGVGCGLEEDDFETIVVSAGTSGTINRVCQPNRPLAGNAACFEYYRNRLLLMMLADFFKWYDRYVAKFAPDHADRLDALNAEIATADLNGIRRVLHAAGREIYPPDWAQLALGQQAASTQFSIMLELLRLTRAMLREVPGTPGTVRRFVLTGGLSQSPFLRQVFHAGVQLLEPAARVEISARRGPLRYQTAAYGALLNAMRPGDPRAATRLCPTRAIPKPPAAIKKLLQYHLTACGLERA